MPEFKQKPLQASPGPSTKLTAKRPPPDPTMSLVEPVVGFVQGALSGFATEQMAGDVREATGASVSPQEVEQKTQEFTKKQGQLQGPGITPEQYAQASQQFLGELDVDAKTALNLVESGQISSLQGEAFVRKRVASAMANPFWAALGGRIQDAAGPLGGGRDIARSALGTPEMSLLEAKAEGQRKAAEEYEKTISQIMYNTKYSRSTVEAFTQRKARHQQMQADRSITVTQQVNLAVEGDNLAMEEAIGGAINPETGMIDAAKVAELNIVNSQLTMKRKAYINSQDIPQAEKDAKIAMLDKQQKGWEERIKLQSRSTVLTASNEEAKIVYESIGNKDNPGAAYLMANGWGPMLNAFPYLSSEQIAKTVGVSDAARIKAEAVYEMPRLFGAEPGPIRPNPVLGGAFSAPNAPEIVKESVKNADYIRNLIKQTKTYPVETVQGLNKGPMVRAANANEAAAQETIITSTKTVVGLLQNDRQIASLATDDGQLPRIEASPKPVSLKGVKVRDVDVINVPEGMEDKEGELNALFKLVEKSKWMWPEGADKYEAFNAIVNGDHVPSVGEDARSPEDVRVDKLVEERDRRSGQLTMGTPRVLREHAKKRMKEIADELSTNPEFKEDLPTMLQELYEEVIGKPLGKTEAPQEQVFVGDDAVSQVEELEGKLSPIEAYTVREEGYSTGQYDDEKGVATSGVGQTGEFRKMTFKEAFAKHREKADKAIPGLSALPENAQAALYSSWYRGMLSDSPKTIDLINQGKYAEAADEFLDAKDYREGSEGVKRRMERVADALRGI